MKKENNNYYNNNTSYDIFEIVENIHSADRAKRKSASEELLRSLEYWIIHIASEKFPSFIERYGEDLFQEGRIAVLEHITEYDPNRSSPSNFFHPHIVHAMMKYIQEQIFGVSRYYGDVMNIIKKAEEALTESDGKTSHSIEEICRESGLPENTVRKTERIRRNISFIPPEECLSLSDAEQDPTEKVQNRELKRAMEAAVRNLTEDERTAISLYYGICGYEKRDIFGVMTEMNLPMKECQRLIYAAKRHLKKDRTLTEWT